jgi:hypothetical protein
MLPERNEGGVAYALQRPSWEEFGVRRPRNDRTPVDRNLLVRVLMECSNLMTKVDAGFIHIAPTG